MLSLKIGLPQYKNSPPKAQTTAFKNSLLKIGGVDARSLVEIKRRRIGYTLSIYFGVATTQIPAYFQKILDTHVTGATIIQQFSNSAIQQFSNSAIQQFKAKNCLCPYTRAAFFSQTFFFSLISDVLGYIRKRNRLRTYPWDRPHSRYRLWNTFLTLFRIELERGGGQL